MLDEVDLQGYSKCLGSCKDFTASKGAVTSWSVQKWEEAGAVILGKLNMHELGLGMNKISSNHPSPLVVMMPHLLTVQIPPTITQLRALH